MKYRLKDNHADLLKIQQLEALALELDIKLEFGMGRCHVIVGDKEYQLEDIEAWQNGRDHIDAISEFPHCTEWNLTYEK